MYLQQACELNEVTRICCSSWSVFFKVHHLWKITWKKRYYSCIPRNFRSVRWIPFNACWRHWDWLSCARFQGNIFPFWTDDVKIFLNQSSRTAALCHSPCLKGASAGWQGPCRALSIPKTLDTSVLRAQWCKNSSAVPCLHCLVFRNLPHAQHQRELAGTDNSWMWRRYLLL